MRLSFLVLAAVLALSGCATAIRGNTQRIAIATDPPGARCELRNARGEAPVVVDPTPAIAEVRRDNADLEVRCEMPQRLLMVERFASSWSLMGNAIYDFATGTPFTPYIGAGLGWRASSSAMSRSRAARPPSTTPTRPLPTRGWPASPTRWPRSGSSICGYRYFVANDPEFGASNSVTVESEYRSHTVLLSISGGHFPITIDIPSEDEIGRLARLFGNMSQHLKKTLGDLQDLNQKYLGLLGFTTHELKQPLGVLKGYLIMLQDETLGRLNTAMQREAILEMRNSVNLLNDMIMKYLQLSKIEAGKLIVEKKRFNLFEEALGPVIEGESPHLAIKRMRIDLEQESQLKGLELYADPTLMRIVYSNLVTNAIKYGREDGLIVAGYYEDSGYYYFHVRNEGPGIPQDKLEAIFGKFVRLDRKELGRQVGTGLGLYNTREIVEKHGGKIWAESDGNTWADFIFTLPRESSAAQPPRERLAC